MSEEKTTPETASAEEEQDEQQDAVKTEESVPGSENETVTADARAEDTDENAAEDSAGDAAEDAGKAAGDKAENAQPSAPFKPAGISEAELKKLLGKDKTYRIGHAIYIAGIVLLVALLGTQATFYFLGIELFYGMMYVSWIMFYLYVIPCLFMLIGLVMSSVATKRCGGSGNDKVGIAFVAIGAALMIALGTVSIVSPHYRIYETEDLNLRDGQTLRVVKYIPTGIFEPTLKKLPGEYFVDVYRMDGMFAKKLISRQIAFSGFVIVKGTGDNDYALEISAVDGGGEHIPFNYN